MLMATWFKLYLEEVKLDRTSGTAFQTLGKGVWCLGVSWCHPAGDKEQGQALPTRRVQSI